MGLKHVSPQLWASLIVQTIVFIILIALGAANNWFNVWPVAWIVLAWFGGVVAGNSVARD